MGVAADVTVVEVMRGWLQNGWWVAVAADETTQQVVEGAVHHITKVQTSPIVPTEYERSLTLELGLCVERNRYTLQEHACVNMHV